MKRNRWGTCIVLRTRSDDRLPSTNSIVDERRIEQETKQDTLHLSQPENRLPTLIISLVQPRHSIYPNSKNETSTLIAADEPVPMHNHAYGVSPRESSPWVSKSSLDRRHGCRLLFSSAGTSMVAPSADRPIFDLVLPESERYTKSAALADGLISDKRNLHLHAELPCPWDNLNRRSSMAPFVVLNVIKIAAHWRLGVTVPLFLPVFISLVSVVGGITRWSGRNQNPLPWGCLGSRRLSHFCLSLH